MRVEERIHDNKMFTVELSKPSFIRLGKGKEYTMRC